MSAGLLAEPTALAGLAEPADPDDAAPGPPPLRPGRDPPGSRRLFEACRKDDTRRALQLLSGLNLPSGGWMDGLAESKDEKRVADPNFTPGGCAARATGMTPLHHACCNLNAELVAMLLESKADAEVHDAGGFTALHAACSSWSTQTGPHEKGRGQYECPSAGVKERTRAVVSALVMHKADVAAVDQFSQTPLHWVANGRQEGDDGAEGVLMELLRGENAQQALGVQDAEGKIAEDIARERKLERLEARFADAAKRYAKAAPKAEVRKKRRAPKAVWVAASPWRPTGERSDYALVRPTTPRLDYKDMVSGRLDLRTERQKAVMLCHDVIVPAKDRPHSPAPRRPPSLR